MVRAPDGRDVRYGLADDDFGGAVAAVADEVDAGLEVACADFHLLLYLKNTNNNDLRGFKYCIATGTYCLNSIISAVARVFFIIINPNR